MRGPGRPPGGPLLCPECARRDWLLSQLSPLLDYHRGRRQRLRELLALGDEQLLAAVGGRRREHLRAELAAWRRSSAAGQAGICRHNPDFPERLSFPGGPHALHLAGPPGRLRALAGAPCVALLGPARCSDYGAEVARSLARELARAGVTIVAGAHGALPGAAHTGAAEAGRGSLAVAGTGARREAPALPRRASAVSELPAGCRGRGWGAAASERIVAGLGEVAVLVEGEAGREALDAPRLAASLGRRVAAVPGRITSPLARGPHALLAEGARLVTGAGEILELLGLPADLPPPARPPLPRGLSCALGELERGSDTMGSLAQVLGGAGPALAALGELEALGFVRRGRDGRYSPCLQGPELKCGSVSADADGEMTDQLEGGRP